MLQIYYTYNAACKQRRVHHNRATRKESTWAECLAIQLYVRSFVSFMAPTHTDHDHFASTILLHPAAPWLKTEVCVKDINIKHYYYAFWRWQKSKRYTNQPAQLALAHEQASHTIKTNHLSSNATDVIEMLWWFSAVPLAVCSRLWLLFMWTHSCKQRKHHVHVLMWPKVLVLRGVKLSFTAFADDDHDEETERKLLQCLYSTGGSQLCILKRSIL